MIEEEKKIKENKENVDFYMQIHERCFSCNFSGLLGEIDKCNKVLSDNVLSISEVKLNFETEEYYENGVKKYKIKSFSWAPVEIVFRDTVWSIRQMVMEFARAFQSGEYFTGVPNSYQNDNLKLNIDITYFTDCDRTTPASSVSISNAVPVSVSYGKCDTGSNKNSTIKLVVQPEYCILKY